MMQEKQNAKAFTLIEVLIAIGISSFIIYGIYTILFTSYDAYQIATEQIELQRDARKAIDSIVSELRQSSLNNTIGFPAWAASTTGSTIDLTDNQAICFSSARNVIGDFQIDIIDHTPDWQAIVVCAPFSGGGLSQLRRYRVFGAYDFPVIITNVTPNTVHLLDASGAVININRTSGSPGTFDVLANDFNQITFIGGNPLGITINLSGTTKRGVLYSGSLSSSVTLRNQ